MLSSTTFYDAGVVHPESADERANDHQPFQTPQRSPTRRSQWLLCERQNKKKVLPGLFQEHSTSIFGRELWQNFFFRSRLIHLPNGRRFLDVCGQRLPNRVQTTSVLFPG